MNFLCRALIEKSGHDNGFENSLLNTEQQVLLGSARHTLQASITQTNEGLAVQFSEPQFITLLAVEFPDFKQQQQALIVLENELGFLLKAAFKLAVLTPTEITKNYENQVQAELAKLPSNGTEVERMVRQRVGQQSFRQALMTYWGGACAVTGVAIPDVLRASHAKPWSECASDAERLDVYNGFLLNANLDALFDKGLITFDNQGVLQVSPKISGHQKELLGLRQQLQLRSLSPSHLDYLEWHRKHLFRKNYLSKDKE